MCGTTFTVGCQVDWSRYLDSYANGSVVNRWISSILPQRKDFVLGLSSTTRNASRRFHTRSKTSLIFQLNIPDIQSDNTISFILLQTPRTLLKARFLLDSIHSG